MTASARPFTTLLCLAAALVLLAPAPATALRPDVTQTDDRDESRTPIAVVAERADVAPYRIALNSRIGRDLMAYRFRLQAVDASGQVLEIPEGFALHLHLGTVGWHSLVQLTASRRDLTLPRPLAVRMGADDSLVVVINFPAAALGALSLRVSIDYEPGDRPSSRMPVVPLRTASRLAPDGRTGTWEWSPQSDGRVLAMSGIPLEEVAAVTVQEVESGATLWSTTMNAVAPGAALPDGAVLRLGVPVSAGRTYRLTVTFTGPAAGGERNGDVLAMVLPSTAR